MRLPDLHHRLDCLAEAGIITPAAAEVTKSALDRVRSRSSQPLRGLPVRYWVTHLARALTRVSEGAERTVPPAEELMKEVRASPYYNQALEEIYWLKRMWPKRLPEGEIQYLSIHYVTVFQFLDNLS
ncbi:hypothetical protein GCM10011571_22440 [Marinithermofilum abyssi]|uniref:PRD domain-containing protein n=1 Tax=Marinithermofilum abyssi TaxID=1571185 RepID=A0A8J2VH39_9BACL|nr:PRD domain-containing protein [Marinithermofilum abyssi]GGE20004.1 hypothetical protein GCM10011571_22440 [Marinithermofilum abyssi]